MQKKTKNSIVLRSVFHANAHLKSSKSHLKNELEKLAYLKPLAYGTCMRYSLHPFSLQHGCLIEFTKSSIDYSFSFSAPSEIEYVRNLLSFIAILSYIKTCYDIDLGSIYPYLVEALQTVVVMSPKEASFNVAALSKRAGELCRSNSILSKELLSMQYEMGHLNDMVERLSAFVTGAISNMPRLSNGKYNPITIASALGIEPETVAEALSAIKNGEKSDS